MSAYCIIGPDDPALNVLAHHLNQHPEYQTELKIIPWANYRDRLMETLTAPQSTAQAVFVPGHVWLPELAAAGYFTPLDTLIKKVPAAVRDTYQLQDIMPSIASESRFQGQQYMLPLFTDGHILFYRSDLMSLPDHVIRPLQLAQIAASITPPQGMHTLALKAHASEILLDWLPYLWDAGGDIFDHQGRPAFASEAGVHALEAYIDLKKFCPPNPESYGNAEIASALINGEVVMATSWGGQAAHILLNPANRYAHLIKTAVFPKPWNATWGMCIPSNQDESIQLEILSIGMQAAAPDQDREVTRVAGSPVRPSSYSPAELQKYSWLFTQHEMLKRAGTLPLDPRLGAFLGDLYGAIYSAFTGQYSPGEALKQALIAAEKN